MSPSDHTPTLFSSIQRAAVRPLRLLTDCVWRAVRGATIPVAFLMASAPIVRGGPVEAPAEAPAGKLSLGTEETIPGTSPARSGGVSLDGTLSEGASLEGTPSEGASPKGTTSLGTTSLRPAGRNADGPASSPEPVADSVEATTPADELLAARPIIGLPIHLPIAASVKDPIFALLIGLVDGNLYGTLEQGRIQAELDRRHSRSKLPYQHVLDVTRLPAGEGRPTNEIHIRFTGPLKLPVPYSILGYNPGSFRATETCTLREWNLGDVRLQHLEKEGDDVVEHEVFLEDAHLYGVTEGEIVLDIDGWIDRLMGGSLDDTDIVALLLCRYNGVWHGFAMGYNKDHKGRSGALDFMKDEIVFPSPGEVKTVGRKMRARAEALLGAAQR